MSPQRKRTRMVRGLEIIPCGLTVEKRGGGNEQRVLSMEKIGRAVQTRSLILHSSEAKL